MKKRYLIISFLCLMFILTPLSIHADEINKFYAKSDNNLKINDDINADTALAGEKVDIGGNINGIGFIAGNNVTTTGNIEYGFIAGNNISLQGEVEKSLYIAGNNITFEKNSNVGRDIFIAGENVNLSGNINRNATIYATNVTINDNTTIQGNIKIKAQEITINNNVKIAGTLTFNEEAKAKFKDSLVTGKIVKTKTEKKENKIDTQSLLTSIINIIIVFLVIALLMPKTTNKIITNVSKKNYAKRIANGLLLLVCIPFICLLLLISNVGFALGLILTALYIIAIYLSYIFAGIVLGELLIVNLLKLKSNKYITGIIGILLIKALALIPLIGAIAVIFALTIGLNEIWQLLTKEDEINDKQINIENEKQIKSNKKENIKEAEIIKEKTKIKETKTKTKTNKDKK